MQDLAKFKLVYNLSRSISTCNINLSKYASREGKFMTKIMREEQGRRKWYAQPERPVPTGGLSKKPQAVPRSNRRNTVLNKLFMKHITDLMATGEVASDIVGKGIQISRVNVTPDFHQVNVYWLAQGDEKKDKLVEESLTRAEGPLRHELSQLRVMGIVPTIKFVKDKQYIRFMEIDRRLTVADFGEDFVPTDRTLWYKTTPVLNVKLPSEVWSDIEELEEDIDKEYEEVEEILPEMRNDVLGLDHSHIMAKVKTSIDKSISASKNRALNIVNPVPENIKESAKVSMYLTIKQRNATFSEFLMKRQLAEKLRKKSEMNKHSISEEERYALDKEYSDAEDEILDLDIHEEKIQER